MKNNLSLLTPVDILNLHFPRRVSGYDVAEVDAFVRRVAGDMETVLAESAALKERIAGTGTRNLAVPHSGKHDARCPDTGAEGRR